MPRLPPSRRQRQERGRATLERAVWPKIWNVDGFAYSDANKASGIVWDEATFKTYIKDPRAAMPGNKMAFAGLSDEQDVADLIAYLHTFDGVAAPK